MASLQRRLRVERRRLEQQRVVADVPDVKVGV
jgi:hypothetical protein